MAEKKTSGLESTVLSTVDSYVERFIAAMVDEGAKLGPISRMIDSLSPAMRMAVFEGLPGAVGLAVSRIPSNTFGNPERTEFAKDVLREVGKRVADAVGNGAASTEEIDRAIAGAESAVKGRKFLLDNQLGLYHLPDCARLANMFLPKGRKHAEVSYASSIEQGLKACPYCFPKIQAEASSVGSEGKKGQTGPRKDASPLDIIGMMETGEQRSFNRWLNSMTAEERCDALEALEELDSIEEFRGLMALKGTLRKEALVLLRNRNAIHSVKGFLSLLGSAAKAGWTTLVNKLSRAAHAYLQYDESLAPAVEERRRRIGEKRAARKRPVRWSFLEMIKPF